MDLNLENLVQRLSIPAARGEGDVVGDFQFEDNDIVFVGEGPCGDAALESVANAGATAIMLSTAEAWRKSPRTWISPHPENMLFDVGNVPRSQRRLEALGAELAGLNLHIFLAGDIPQTTTFRPPALVEAKILINGAPPRAYERRGFEKLAKRIGFTVSSLHDVPAPYDLSAFPRPRWEAELALQIADAREAFHAHLFALRAANSRPLPFDPVTRATDSAITVHFLQDGKSMIIRRWRDGLFDTAYFDVSLLEAYHAERNITRMLVEENVILLRPAKLFERAAQLGIELQPLDSRLYQ